MRSEDILAVVVSFNGGEKTIESVMALVGQVGYILIIDNASEASSLDLLGAIETLSGVSVVRLNENLGIGHALNLGVGWARELGFQWLLTMDQDSRVEPDMVNAYTRALVRNPDSVCLTPCLVRYGLREQNWFGEVDYAITSGNLVKLEVFDKIGPYNEQMFIDCVDFDFCLRLRAAGWAIFRVGDAHLHHELGERHQVVGSLARFYTLHAPLRRYYMYRNFFLLAKLHFLRFPGFMLKSAVAHTILLFLIPFYDKAPYNSLSAIMKGVFDFIIGNFGKCMRKI